MRLLLVSMSLLIYFPLIIHNFRDCVIGNAPLGAAITVCGAAASFFLAVRDQSGEDRGNPRSRRAVKFLRRVINEDKYTARLTALLFACFPPTIIFLNYARANFPNLGI